MFQAVTKGSEISECQRVLRRKLEKTLGQRTKAGVGYQGDAHMRVVWHSAPLWYSYAKDTSARVPKHWNAFGLNLRSTGSNSIIVEINPPLNGYTKQVAGLFAKTKSGKIALLHTGKIGGGRKGIGKQKFRKWFKGEWVKVANDRNTQDDAILVAYINAQTFVKNVLDFVEKVNRFKELTRTSPPLSEKTIGDEEDSVEVHIRENTKLRAAEKKQLIMARRGQGRFRKNVEMHEKHCRITGVSQKPHLRASHIKPWRRATNKEKLDGNNGLLLAPHIDHLFDRGYISFRDDGSIRLSRLLDRSTLRKWHINPKINVGVFRKAQRAYLKYHREHIFKEAS